MHSKYKFQIGNILLYYHITFKVVSYGQGFYLLQVVKNNDILKDMEDRVYSRELVEDICTLYVPHYNRIWNEINS